MRSSEGEVVWSLEAIRPRWVGVPASSRVDRAHHVGTLEHIVMNSLFWINPSVVPELETQNAIDEAVVRGKTDLERQCSGEKAADQVCGIAAYPADQKC